MDKEIRIIGGQVAVLVGTDLTGPWEREDGTRWWFCAAEHCHGLRWKASNVPHPTTCTRPQDGNGTMIEGLIHHARLVNKITGWTTTDDVRELARALENAGHILADYVEQQRPSDKGNRLSRLARPSSEATMSRPEYVKCIAQSREDLKGKAWCGRSVAAEWAFTSLDHAALNALAEGRLLACRDCIRMARAALMSRPEYVKCIAQSREDLKGKAWCGRSVAAEWAFTSLDHAALNALAEGRLLACRDCIRMARAALMKVSAWEG